MRLGSRALVLMYHRIATVENDPWSLCVSPGHFAEHLEVLRKYDRRPLPALAPGGWQLGWKLSVAVTFDDGYADNLHAALPLLRRYDTPATFFIATGYIGSAREFWWDELERMVYGEEGPARDARHLQLYSQLQPLCSFEREEILGRMWGKPPDARASHRVLTAEELERLASDSLIEIGAHTVTHPLLAAQSVEAQRAEIRDSKAWLESRLGRTIRSFSYPYGGTGHYTTATVDAARDCGFHRALTTTPSAIRKSASPFEWGRVQVPDVDGGEFEKFLQKVGA